MSLIEYDFEKLSSVCIRKREFWEEVKAIFKRNSFKFEIVYTDGLVSSLKTDRKGREPFGFVINKEIIRFDAPSERFKLKLVMKFLDNRTSFAGLKPHLPSYTTLRYIRKHFNEINDFIDEFNGTRFFAGWYGSCSLVDVNSSSLLKKATVQNVVGKKVYAVHTSCPKDIGFSYATNETDVFVRIAYSLY